MLESLVGTVRSLAPADTCGTAVLLAATLLPLAATRGGAATGRFSAVAPNGGTVLVLASDPSDDAVVYAGTRRAGVFRSLDGGASWHAASRGLGGEQVSALAVAASDPDVLYASIAGTGSGVYRSGDRGESWRRVGAGQVTGALGLAIQPTDRDVVVAANGSRVWKTGDGGVSWVDITPTPLHGYRIPLFDPNEPSTLYVGTDGGFVKTVDLGETWTHSASIARSVLSLLLDPLHSQSLWAGVRGGVFHTVDGGGSWTFLSLPVDPLDDVTALALDPHDPNVVYAGAGRFELTGTIFGTDDGGTSWHRLLETTGVSSLSADGEHAGRLLAGVRDLGVLETTDGGVSWHASRQGLGATVVTAIAVDPQRPGTLVAGLDDGPTALSRSGDGGETWTAVNIDRFLSSDTSTTRTAALTIDPTRPDRLYGDFNGVLALSPDFGRTWQPLQGQPRFLVQSLAVTGTGGLVAASVEAVPCAPPNCSPPFLLHLYHSIDDGETWQEADLPPLSSPSWPVLAVAPSDPSLVYFSGRPPLVSRDGGETWQPVGGEMPPPIHGLAVHPLDGRVLYAATRLRAGGVLRSLDGGSTWRPPAGGLPPGEDSSQAVTAVLIDPLDPQRIYAASQFGVFESRDGGVTWSTFSEGLVDVPVTVLALDTQGLGTLYAGGPLRGGLFARTRDSQACSDGPSTLCLGDGRFRALVRWRDFTGGQGAGHALPLLEGSGGFWFFDPSSLEVVVKVVDGRSSNGHFWVFVSSLTNVAFELDVVDTEDGAVWSYANPTGHFASFADVTAF